MGCRVIVRKMRTYRTHHLVPSRRDRWYTVTQMVVASCTPNRHGDAIRLSCTHFPPPVITTCLPLTSSAILPEALCSKETNVWISLSPFANLDRETIMSTTEGSSGVPEAPPLLPTSAPVSSLLPPIPNHSSLLQHHLQVSIQAQLAALLAGPAPPTALMVPPPANPMLAASALPPNPLLGVGDMHGWSVEQIGTSSSM
jgi:hypothetical protein